MERPEPDPQPDPESDDTRGSQNELGYRNVDEEAEHDERGSQGPGPTEPPPREP
jgi:hypothetical protein